MIGFYLRLIGWFGLLFTAVMLLIHIQPATDPALRDLLMPPDCQTPCFMGIRPGVTTGEEALHLVEISGWAKKIRGMTHSNPNLIVWDWSGAQPEWIVPYADPAIILKNDIVTSLMVWINTSFVTAGNIFGDPVRATWTITGESIRSPHYTAYYPEIGILLEANHRSCDFHLTQDVDNTSFVTYQTHLSIPKSLITERQTLYDACKYLWRTRKK